MKPQGFKIPKILKDHVKTFKKEAKNKMKGIFKLSGKIEIPKNPHKFEEKK